MAAVSPMTADPAPARNGASDLTLRDRVLGWRDRLLANPSFQRFAGTFALTRPIARSNAAALFDLCAGFVYSQILYACVQERLLDSLAQGPVTAEALAAQHAMPVEAMTLLLDAAAALKLVQTRSKGRYGLGPLGAALRGNPGVIAMIAHHRMLYGDLQDPLALLRGTSNGELARYWPYATGAAPLTREAIAPYTALMSASQPMIASQVLAAYSFAAHRHILDVGGGDGAFLRAVLAQHPLLRCTLFDLPPVAETARERFAAAGMAARASCVGGSFLGDDLPQGADIVSLVRVIHDHDDVDVMTLLRAVHRALPDNGTLLLAEPMSGTPGAEAMGDAYFAFYLRAMGSGRPRSFAQLSQMLSDAGFASIRMQRTPMPMLASVMTAKKPPSRLA